MKINPVNSTPGCSVNKSDNSTFTRINSNKQNLDSTYLIIGLAGLAVIGAAAVISTSLKKNNLSPSKIINNTALNIKKKHAKKPPIDPLYVFLDGKRDGEAVRIYNSYTSRQKLHSLEKRFASGEFIGKGDPLDYIHSNRDRLQRVSKNVI